MQTELRAYLQRLLGWEEDRAVERAVIALAKHAEGNPLVLVGEGDLSAVARELHRRGGRANRPFSACNWTASCREILEEARLSGAAGGTLCVWGHRLPSGLSRLCELHPELRLVVCLRGLRELSSILNPPICIPSLRSREDELDRVIDAIALDAQRTLRLAETAFPASDRAWVREHASHTHSEIERATLRVVALRASGGVMTRAAARLGISHVALSRWLARRRLEAAVGMTPSDSHLGESAAWH